MDTDIKRLTDFLVEIDVHYQTTHETRSGQTHFLVRVGTLPKEKALVEYDSQFVFTKEGAFVAHEKIKTITELR